MNPWLARVLALGFAGAAIFLVVLNAHAARVPLEAALAAAVLCVLSVVLLWRIPAAAAIVNVLCVVAALVFAHLPGMSAAPVETYGAAGASPQTAATPEAEVAAVANRAGASPESQLALVTGGVRYEIYPGVFRGATATLADGAGNDYDRALLLHDLLASSHAGAVRYAFCTLGPQQTDEAVAAARKAYVAPSIGENAQALAQKARTQAMRNGYTHIATFWKAAVAQERQQTAELATDFQKANVPLVPPKGADLRPIAADHVWVQLQRGTQWVDLDPSVSPAKPGTAACAASKTSDALPDSSFDTVTLTLQYESRDGDRENAATVASQTWRTVELATTPLTFAFAESSGLHAPAPQPSGMRTYTPLLVAGTQTISAPPITVPTPIPGGFLKNTSKIASQGPSQAVTAFGTEPPPTPSPLSSPSAPIPVALRLDVAVAAPNVPSLTAEHVIFDRVSAAQRAAGRAASAPIAPISLLPFGTVLNVAVNLGSGVVGVGGYDHFDRNSTDPANVNRGLGRMHRAYYALRRAAFAELSTTGPPVVSVRPGVSFLGFAPYPAGPVEFGLMMDRAVEGAMPDSGDASSSLGWGVASVYGERLTIGSSAMQSGRNLDQLPFDDSIEMFYIARHNNVAPVLVRSSADVSALSASDDAKARLSARIADGSRVIVPSSQVSYGGSNDVGWWILAADGSVTDEMQSGLHADELPGEAITDEEAAEEAPTEAKEGGNTRCAVWVTGAMFIVAFGAAGITNGGEEAAEEFEKAQEIMHALNEEKETEEIVETAERCSEGGGNLPPGATSPPLPPPPLGIKP